MQSSAGHDGADNDKYIYSECKLQSASASDIYALYIMYANVLIWCV